MDEEQLKQALIDLNMEQAQLLFWMCSPPQFTDQQLGDKIIKTKPDRDSARGRSTGWVHIHRNQIESKVTAIGYTSDSSEVCNAIRDLSDMLPSDERGGVDWHAWPPELAELDIIDQVEEEPDTSDRIEEDADTNGDEVSPPEEVDTTEEKERSIWPLIAAGVLAVIIGIGSLFAYNNDSVEPTIEPTGVSQVTEEPDPDIVSVPTEEPTVVSEPTDIPEPTPFVFTEEFETADFSGWNRVVGDPVVANGQLQGGNETRWYLGDESWQNYVIEYRFSQTGCNGVPNYFGVRMQDDINMLLYRFGGCFGDWSVLVNGERTNVIEAVGGSRGGTIRIRVVDDSVQIFRGNELALDYPNASGYDNGGIVFGHSRGTLEWIRVERLD